jgi:hypothetical protein
LIHAKNAPTQPEAGRRRTVKNRTLVNHKGCGTRRTPALRISVERNPSNSLRHPPKIVRVPKDKFDEKFEEIINRLTLRLFNQKFERL